MQSDPHDAMLLTQRPTVVITEATRLLETMPDPYGSSADEEALFGNLGAPPDEPNSPSKKPAPSVAAPSASTGKSIAVGVGLGIAALWLLKRGRG